MSISLETAYNLFLKGMTYIYFFKIFLLKVSSQAVLVHTFNPSTCEAEAGGFL